MINFISFFRLYSYTKILVVVVICIAFLTNVEIESEIFICLFVTKKIASVRFWTTYALYEMSNDIEFPVTDSHTRK